VCHIAYPGCNITKKSRAIADPAALKSNLLQPIYFSAPDGHPKYPIWQVQIIGKILHQELFNLAAEHYNILLVQNYSGRSRKDEL